MRKQKQVSGATRAMLAEMESDARAPASADKVERAREKVIELRDIEFECASLESRLKELRKRSQEIKERELVDLMQLAKLDNMGVPAEGNYPAFDVTLDDYFHANIPKENEERAFAWLEKQDLGDMIKTTFTVSFGMGEGKECAAFEKKLTKTGEPYEKKQGVPWNTLTAYIKGEFRAGRPLTERVLGMLGATVGRIAKVKTPKKEK